MGSKLQIRKLQTSEKQARHLTFSLSAKVSAKAENYRPCSGWGLEEMPVTPHLWVSLSYALCYPTWIVGCFIPISTCAQVGRPLMLLIPSCPHEIVPEHATVFQTTSRPDTVPQSLLLLDNCCPRAFPMQRAPLKSQRQIAAQPSLKLFRRLPWRPLSLSSPCSFNMSYTCCSLCPRTNHTCPHAYEVPPPSLHSFKPQFNVSSSGRHFRDY